MYTETAFENRPGYATRWKGLIFIGISLIVMSMDNTILNNAIPAISTDLGASASDLQWIVDAYILVFAALMLTTGAIGDRFGRKKALQTGLVLFGLGSLAAALSHSTGMLIAARGFLGVGAATLMPASLSIISATFPHHERPQAIAIWAAIFSLGIGVGPVLGGFLVQNYAWNWVFLINLPVIAVALIGGALYLADSRDETAAPPDIPGVILSIIGLFALIYGIIEAGVLGWTHPTVLTALGVAVIFIAVFGWWENRAPNAMLPLSLFRNMSFTGANIILGFAMFSLFGSTFFLSQYFQTVLGFSPLQAGLYVLPTAIPMTFAASMSARVAHRLGTRYTVALGLMIATAALFYMSRAFHVDTPYPLVMIGQMLMGTGLGIAVSPATNSIMGAVPVRRAGVASAMNNTLRQLGGALGIAVLGTVMNNLYLGGVQVLKAQLPASAFETISSSIQAAHNFAHNTPGSTSETVLSVANQSFVNGMNNAMLVGSIIMALTVILTLVILPARVRVHHEDAEMQEIAAVAEI